MLPPKVTQVESGLSDDGDDADGDDDDAAVAADGDHMSVRLLAAPTPGSVVNPRATTCVIPYDATTPSFTPAICCQSVNNAVYA